MKKLTSLFIILLLAIIVSAQTEKRPLSSDDILKWNRITETHVSNNGETIVYKQEPWKGDPTLKITTAKGEEITSIIGGTGAKITTDSKFVVFTQKPLIDTVRTLKLKKTKKDDLPKDKLIIYNFKSGETDTIKDIKSHKVPVEWSGWIAWQTEAQKDTTKKEETKPDKKKEKKSGSDKVHPLFIMNTNSGKTNEIPAVSSYVFAEEKEVIVFISEGKDSTFDAGIYVYNLTKETEFKIENGKAKFKQLTINKSGDKVAFLKDILEEKENNTKYNLHVWEGNENANEIVNFENGAIPKNWEISENGTLSFSENSSRLFFGTAPKKVQKDTTILEEEIPILDIWTWNEEILQTVQLNKKEKDIKKSYLAVVHLDNEQMVQLETEIFTGIRKINKGDSEKIIA